MVARVILSRTAIKVSKPGSDVTTAGIKDLLLDVGYRNQQILEHGLIPMSVSSGGSAGLGPWEGSRPIGNYGSIPDVTVALVFSSGKQLNPPRIDSAGAGRGRSGYFLSKLEVTQNQISAKIGQAQVGYDQAIPPDLVGLSYVIFRKGYVS